MDTANKILEVVAKEYGVDADELISKCRKRRVAEARQMAMMLLCKVLDFASTEVGKMFGRDHSTVLYSVHRAEDLISVDKAAQRHHANIIGEPGFAGSAK